MSSNWQKIGGIEVCEGTDGAVGIVWSVGSLLTIDRNGVQTSRVESFFSRGTAQEAFENAHCRPLHKIEECADGSVIVRSVEKIDGKTARCAMVRAVQYLFTMTNGIGGDFYDDHEKAIAAAVAYVSAR